MSSHFHPMPSHTDTQDRPSESPLTHSQVTAASRRGVLVRGLPQTHKYDKLLSVLGSDKDIVRLGKICPGVQKQLWGTDIPIKTTLYSFCDEEGKKKTTGEALFIFETSSRFAPQNRNCDETALAQRVSGIRLDKSHTLQGEVIRVCDKCLIDTHYYKSSRDGCKAAQCDPSFCEQCLACSLCKKPPAISSTYRNDGEYITCQECMESMTAQEKWRDSMPVHDTQSSYDIKDHLYLSEEAIEREKEILGGIAPLPDESMRPFYITSYLSNLIDPTSKYYWPYGQSGYDYLVSQEEMRFNNPVSETPGGEWRSVEVNDEIIREAWTKMENLKAKYKFNSLRDPGSIPSVIMSSCHCFSYRLIPKIHGFTCDSPLCQAINHHYDDGGAYNALVLTGIPIYTSRLGDLMNDDVSKLSYGKEYCLSCISD
jgi:hypothetical protein